MFLIHGNDVVDYDLDVLLEVLAVVDRQVEIIQSAVSQSLGPDASGRFGRMEGIVGLGFVACQQYLNATYPQLAASSRRAAIASDPMHASGRSFAQLIDAAANYWKHHDEWLRPENERLGVKTREVIDALTPSSADYVLGNVLAELVRPERPRFAPVACRLTQWRDLQIAPSV